MTDPELRFKASIESLERLHSEYIKPWKPLLESRSPTQLQNSTQNVSSVASVATVPAPPIIINDYIRMCHVYAIALWTCWESLGIRNSNLDELRLIRNCLVHHEGDMAAYSQHQDPRFKQEGARLINLTQGKSYVQGYNLVISEVDLISLTSLVKFEAMSLTGVIF